MLKSLFDFFIFTSLFIALCAVLMVCQTALLFGLDTSITVYAFVFSGSVCSYNFHWFLTPPQPHNTSGKLKWNISNRPLHFALFLLGAAGSAITAFLLIEHWEWLAITAFLTFLYSAPQINHPLFIWLRRIAVGKAIYLAFAWMHVTTLLPLLISLEKLEAQHICFAVNRFFFLYCICIVFDRRDVESDRKAGIKSLITWLSPKGVDVLFWLSAIAVLVTSVILLKWMPVLYTVILFFPMLIMAALYGPSKKNFSDYFYYFLLDGLMAFSAPLLIFLRFARKLFEHG